MNYDDLMKEVEAAVMDGRIGLAGRHNSGESRSGHPQPIEEEVDDTRIASPQHASDDRHANGNMATGTGQYVNYDAYSDESDAEAAAGLAMLQMAEEEERAEESRLHGRTRRETNDSIFSAYAAVPRTGHLRHTTIFMRTMTMVTRPKCTMDMTSITMYPSTLMKRTITTGLRWGFRGRTESPRCPLMSMVITLRIMNTNPCPPNLATRSTMLVWTLAGLADLQNLVLLLAA